MSPRWVDTWARDMVMWYWSVAILFWQLSIDHFVNVQYTRCGLAKTRLRHPSLPFDSLPYPTLTICRRVRTYVRSVNHVTTKQKEVDHILWVWGSAWLCLFGGGKSGETIEMWWWMGQQYKCGGCSGGWENKCGGCSGGWENWQMWWL